MIAEILNSLWNDFPSYSSRKTVDAFPRVLKVVEKRPETVVYFTDGTKSSVKCADDDVYSLEAGFLAAVVKRIYGRICQEDGHAEYSGFGSALKRILTQKTFHAEKKAEKSVEKKAVVVKAPVQKTSKISRCLHDAAKRNCCKSDTLTKVKRDEYVRPAKPFKNFTQEEKRAYWRWQKRK